MYNKQVNRTSLRIKNLEIIPDGVFTAIAQAMGPRRGLAIALRLGWPLRLPQIRVTRPYDFCF